VTIDPTEGKASRTDPKLVQPDNTTPSRKSPAHFATARDGLNTDKTDMVETLRVRVAMKKRRDTAGLHL
jgi:hypothetical protein